ncbi:hypothetical protein LTS18_003271 [Coniosporium uncinatum]|uniref:Uncharacterized protein n=1 Tax=Coniosporium uncinatum TaxID=93489 RepID=A0ACC3DTD3_9PEZI|nr:hypothetical protein LTS18_003271 [Coniosporium uncinatum]
MKAVLEPDSADEASADDVNGDGSDFPRHHRRGGDGLSLSGTTIDAQSTDNGWAYAPSSDGASLSHVFPFQRPPTPPPDTLRPPAKKRVSMDTRSMSSSSGYSFASRSNSMHSHTSGPDGDTSIEKLCKTQGSEGESIMMMAVENGQAQALRYLLSLDEYYSLDDVIGDANNEGTTLLSAAVQQGNAEVTDVILSYLLQATSSSAMSDYFRQQDTKGRSVAHYLFNLPHLIDKVGHLIPWTLKDKNGQTPLFALSRSYDHEEYGWMVDTALSYATEAQKDGDLLHVDDHVDNRGNTLLHIVMDPQLIARLLYHTDSEVNAANDKHFTPLMVASKYGRGDLVRALFSDPRVDLYARDLRGLTAVELAKDDEVRNRIDDLVLLATPPMTDGRTTTVVRSFFFDDGNVKFIVKSGAPNANATITVTTCKRTLTDFENLAKWLSFELPASWIPSISNLPSPYLIPSRPSRSILRDTQMRLDSFLRTLLTHNTFSTHEMVWEFFLVPDVDFALFAERSRKKAELRAETVREDYAPILDVREVELFVSHAKDSVRSVHHATKSVLRRINKLRHSHADLYDAGSLAVRALSTLSDGHHLSTTHIGAVDRYTKTLAQKEHNPLVLLYYSLLSISSSMTAILAALTRPSSLIAAMSQQQKNIDRHRGSLRRNDKWSLPLGLLDDTRKQLQHEAAEKEKRGESELEALGRELRYTQGVVAGELAMWQEERVRSGRRAVREFARRMVVGERARLEGMRRAVRGVLSAGRKVDVASGGGKGSVVGGSDGGGGGGVDA